MCPQLQLHFICLVSISAVCFLPMQLCKHISPCFCSWQDLYLLCHKTYKASGLSFSGMLICHVFSNLPSSFRRRPSATTLALALLSMRLQMIRQEMSKLGFSTKMNTVAFNRLWFDSLADQCFTELSLIWGHIYNLHMYNQLQESCKVFLTCNLLQYTTTKARYRYMHWLHFSCCLGHWALQWQRWCAGWRARWSRCQDGIQQKVALRLWENEIFAFVWRMAAHS